MLSVGQTAARVGDLKSCGYMGGRMERDKPSLGTGPYSHNTQLSTLKTKGAEKTNPRYKSGKA